MSPRRLLIRRGRVVDPASGIDGRRDVLISGGKVRSVDRSIPPRKSDEVLDASGLWVIPGIIDMHVHLREPGGEASETIETGTRAAAEGGVTTVLAMPNTRPAIDSPGQVRRVRSLARAKGKVNVLVAAAVTRGQRGERLTDMERLAAAGAGAFTDDGRPVMSAELMRRALCGARALGLPVLDHSEDDDLSAGGVLHEGPAARRAKVRGIPAASESLMALRNAALCDITRGPLHLCHVSCAPTVELVRRVKAAGLPVTAEAAPHHFTLCDANIPRGRRAVDFKMKPPLRSRADLRAVREGLADGTLDAIATDHAPHSPALKSRGLGRAPFGVIGLETVVPLSLSLVGAGLLSRKALVDRLSAAPARILGLRSKGSLRRGADADVTIIDPEARWTAGPRYASKSRNSPFTGRRLKGRAHAALVGGRVVFHRGDRS